MHGAGAVGVQEFHGFPQLCTADNGIVTADGIKIGSTINDIMRVYGEPKNSVRDRITNRFNMFFYNVEGERRIGIRFDFDLEGYVTKIGSGYFD